jgi:hypothetical protein
MTTLDWALYRFVLDCAVGPFPLDWALHPFPLEWALHRWHLWIPSAARDTDTVLFLIEHHGCSEKLYRGVRALGLGTFFFFSLLLSHSGYTIC